MSMTNDDLLTSREVAEQFRVSLATVSRWGRAGIVPSVKVGGIRRFRRSDVVQAMTPTGGADQDGAA